jgi:hypothetical protein
MDPPISYLPDDVLTSILILVGDVYLFNIIPLVSKHWHGLINNEMFWKKRYLDCAPLWQSYLSYHIPKSKIQKLLHKTTAFYENWIANEEEISDPKLQEELLWKQKYFIQYSRNNPEYYQYIKEHRQTVSFSNHSLSLQPKKMNFSPAFKNTYKILVVGEGLETSAKKLVYDMMWGTNTPFKMTGLYPGTEGIGSGVGFEVNGVDLNISAIYNYFGLLSYEYYMQKWIDLFRESHGLIFVMDLVGDPSLVKSEMDLLKEYAISLPVGLPLLVLACKQQIEESTCISPQSIADQLQLNELGRPWCVRTVEIRSLDGLYEGMDWILSWL